jgi:hypothetical protein
MIELARKTATAERRIGSQSEAIGTIGTSLFMGLDPRAYLALCVRRAYG